MNHALNRMAAGLIALAWGCGGKPALVPVKDAGPSSSTGIANDAGQLDAGIDGGPADGGALDGGPADGGPPLHVGPWAFYGPGQGVPRSARGVSTDERGNVWVAGGADGLFLLRPGAQRFIPFTTADGLHPYPVLSVAGGRANEVIVGYQGLFGGQEDNDPAYMITSGDADRVILSGGGLTVTHFDIATPPGFYPNDPDVANGRDKIRTVYRILYNHTGPYAGDIWFGGNHGVAMWEARYNGGQGVVLEHQHCAIQDQYGHINTGDWLGLAMDKNGDLWMGSENRETRLAYATGGGQFWAGMQDVTDAWPDGSEDPTTWVRDNCTSLAVDGAGAVWIASSTQGLARRDPSGRLDFYTTGNMPFTTNGVWALDVDPDGSLWIGFADGTLGRMRGGQYQRIDQSMGIPSNGLVTQISIDTSSAPRTVWASFEDGFVGRYAGP